LESPVLQAEEDVKLVPSIAARAVPSDLVLRTLGDLAPRRIVYAALPRSPLPAARVLVRFLAQVAGQ
jgi:hypothetical protein